MPYATTVRRIVPISYLYESPSRNLSLDWRVARHYSSTRSPNRNVFPKLVNPQARRRSFSWPFALDFEPHPRYPSGLGSSACRMQLLN